MKFSYTDFSRFWPATARAATLTLTLALAACQGDFANRADAPIPPQTVALMSEKGVDPESPTLIRAYKKESELEIWKMRPDGRYVHLKTFPMCRWSGQLGPKTREGDRQVPEGFYSITPAQMNPNSNYYLSFNVGYPNQLDRALGHTGGTIMVHGACSSAGCFSMTDAQIAEIYAIARTSFAGGQRAIQMQSFPFRMTPENLAKHRLDQNMAFWKQLKEGNDHFEVTQKEPRVAFCGRRYVFNAAPGDGQNMDVNAACPTLKHNPEVALAVAEKADQDNRKVAELASNGVRPVRLVYQDGGQHPSFASRVAEVSRPETLTPPTEIALTDSAAKTASERVSATSLLAAKAPVVSPALAMSAAAHHAAEAPDAVTRALASDSHRAMSAIAEDVETTGAIKKPATKKPGVAGAKKTPATPPRGCRLQGLGSAHPPTQAIKRQDADMTVRRLAAGQTLFQPLLNSWRQGRVEAPHMYDMLPDELIWRLSVSLAIGLLIGLERGWKARDAAEGERTAGVRTHALAGLLGGVWGAVAAPYGGSGVIALALAFVAFVAVIALFRLREITAEHIYGATTVVAAMLAFVLGAFAVMGEPLPAIAGGVATAALLASKTALHAWLQRLSWPELRSGLVLLVMSFILLPALPNHPVDPWGAINPFALWLLTVLIAVISFVGYVAVKTVGYRQGLAVAGLAGGLASSTATTAAMARLAPTHPEQLGALAGGAVLANAVMALRVLVILALINADLGLRLAAPLVGVALVYLLAGGALVRSGRAGGDPATEAPLIDNPLDLEMVLKFGLFLALVMVLSRIATHFVGAAGVYAIALLSGMADVDAIALAMGRQGAAEIGVQAAGIAVLLAIASNTVVKTAMGWTLGGRALGARLAIASALAVIAGALILATGHELLG